MTLRLFNNIFFNILKQVFKRLFSIDKSILIGKNTKVTKSEFGGTVIIGDRCLIHKVFVAGNVNIGNNTSLWGPNIQILSRIHPVTIGSFCSIARDVTIQEYYHNIDKLTTYFIGKNVFSEPFANEVVSKGPITIGSDVWIGTGAQILSGINIGHGAVIGANSVVTKDIPPYAVAVGNPAKIIKYRFSDVKIKDLLELKWWEWDIEKIKVNKNLFE